MVAKPKLHIMLKKTHYISLRVTELSLLCMNLFKTAHYIFLEGHVSLHIPIALVPLSASKPLSAVHQIWPPHQAGLNIRLQSDERYSQP